MGQAETGTALKNSISEKKASSWKQWTLLVMLAAFVLFFVLFFIAQNKGPQVKIIREGDRAPEFRLQSLGGGSTDLAGLRGRVVMVHFWATWCPPCVEELPTLARMYQSLMGKDFEMLAVSVDEGGAQAVSLFLQRNRMALPVLLNPDRSVAALYGTFKFPETYLIDRDGIVRYKAIGARDWSLPENMKLIQDLIIAEK